MRRYVPTTSQWKKWSLPSKLSAIGVYIGLPLSVLLFAISYFFPLTDSSLPQYENTVNEVQGPVIQQGPNSSFEGNIIIGATQVPSVRPSVTTVSTQTPTKVPTPILTATPLAFSPAEITETLIVVADFSDKSDNVTYDAAGSIYENLQRELLRYDLSDIRIERLNQSFGKGDYDDVVQLIEIYGASIMIWGNYDDSGMFPRITLKNETEVPSLSEIPDFTLKVSNRLIQTILHHFEDNVDKQTQDEILKVLFEMKSLQVSDLQDVTNRFSELLDFIPPKKVESILSDPTIYEDKILSYLTDLTDPPNDFTFYVNQDLPTFMSFFARLAVALELVQRQDILKAHRLLNDLETSYIFHESISSQDYVSSQKFRESLASVYALRAGINFVSGTDMHSDYSLSISDINQSIKLDPYYSAYYLYRALFSILSFSEENYYIYDALAEDLICMDFAGLIKYLQENKDFSAALDELKSESSFLTKNLSNLNASPKCITPSMLMLVLDTVKFLSLAINDDEQPIWEDANVGIVLFSVGLITVLTSAMIDPNTRENAVLPIVSILLIAYGPEILDDNSKTSLENSRNMYTVVIEASEQLFNYSDASYCTFVTHIPIHSFYFHRGRTNVQMKKMGNAIVDFENYATILEECDHEIDVQYQSINLKDYDSSLSMRAQLKWALFGSRPSANEVRIQISNMISSAQK